MNKQRLHPLPGATIMGGGGIFLSFECRVDRFQKHGHRHGGFTQKRPSKIFELLTSINLSLFLTFFLL